MTMVGDMFNHSLKAKVDGLCSELAQLLTRQPFVAEAPGWSGSWWPGDLGQPNSSGGQNNIRYAYFAGPRRLAVEANGRVTVYDTLDHQIGGVSQQQSSGSSLGFTSQYGTVNVDSLPIVSGDGNVGASPRYADNPARSPVGPPASTDQEVDIFTKIERLADLQRKGVLTPEEFSAKKAELLGRL